MQFFPILFFFFLFALVSICFSHARKSDLELNLLILCLLKVHFILLNSVCLNTYFCSLAQFFQKLTEGEKHVRENSQGPSSPPLPGNTCWGHYYKGAQLSQVSFTKLARKYALPVPVNLMLAMTLNFLQTSFSHKRMCECKVSFRYITW